MSRHDRSGCASWCGKSTSDIYGTMLARDYLDCTTDLVGPGGLCWCSTRCRDLALPPFDSTLPNADARGEGSCGPEPMTALSGRRDTGGLTPSVRAGGDVSASPVNVSPPVPAPGQRWLSTITGLTYDIVKHGALLFIEAVRGEKQDGYREVLPSSLNAQAGTRWSYLGPTPPAVSPPGEVVGVPKGYVPCPNGCGRFMASALFTELWTGVCWGRFPGGGPKSYTYREAKREYPDWTPPAQSVRHKQISTVATGEWKSSPADATSSPVRREWFTGMPNLPKPPLGPAPGIKCSRCLVTSAAGDVHTPTCVVMRERGPSAAEAAPGRVRDTFADLADEWDLLPEASR